jgi:hypothetical protein
VKVKRSMTIGVALAALVAASAFAQRVELFVRGHTLVWPGAPYSAWTVEANGVRETVHTPNYTVTEVREKHPQDTYNPDPQPGKRVAYRVAIKSRPNWSNTVYIRWPRGSR